MNSLLENAPTIDQALDLEVHELAYLVLRQMQTASNPQHAGNLLLELTRTYDPPLHSGARQPQRRNEFELGLAESIEWLCSHGLVARFYETNYLHLFVTRRGLSIDTTDGFRLFLRECDLSPALLHPIVRREAWPLYQRGKFDLAVFEAFKRVEIAVREGGGFGATDLGPPLMRLAFHEDRGPLADKSIPTAERQAISALFAGAIGAFKNPGSHREVGLDDPTRAAELLMLASHLLGIVDERVSELSSTTAA